MARLRTLKPSFFTHEDLAELTPLHRIFFQGLWCYADREGRLEDRPKHLKTVVLPYDECSPDGLLSDLEAAGFIVRYTGDDGGRYIAIPKFGKHQKPHPREAPSEIPPPKPSDFKRKPEKQGLGSAQALPRQDLGVAEPGGLGDFGLGDFGLGDFGLGTSPGLPGAAAPPQLGLVELEPGKEDAVTQVMTHYLSAMKSNGLRPRDSPKNRKLVRDRLKDGFSVDELKQAINGLTWSDHHMKGGYHSLKYALRNQEQVEMMSQRVPQEPMRRRL
jgi:hypothetical protein